MGIYMACYASSNSVGHGETLLKDVLESDVLDYVLNAFGEVCGMGAGIFLPNGERLGSPAHHTEYCELIRGTDTGCLLCEECDKSHVKSITENSGPNGDVYVCHGHLVDMCEPIFSEQDGCKRLIGVFFAGQVRDAQRLPLTADLIKKVLDKADECGIKGRHEILVKYLSIPECTSDRIDIIRNWMRQFAKLIGLMVDKRLTAQKMLLGVIEAADDQDRILRAVQKHMQPAAVSLFLTQSHASAEDDERVYLAATTFAPLVVERETSSESDNLSYKKNEGFTGHVFATGKLLMIRDLHEPSTYPDDVRDVKWKHKVKEIDDVDQSKSFLAVPVRAAGKVVGVLRAVRTRKQPEFSMDEASMLEGIALAVSIAVGKAELMQKEAEKQREVLDALLDPQSTLLTIADKIASVLGSKFVDRGPWKAVYILQLMTGAEKFGILGVYPPGINTDGQPDKGFEFPLDGGVAGEVYKNRKFFAHSDCDQVGVKPAKNWNSVIAEQITNRTDFWGVVALCGQDINPLVLAEAIPEVLYFARQMSAICVLSEKIDSASARTAVIARLASMTTVIHDIKNVLEDVYSAACRLRVDFSNNGIETVDSICQKIHSSLLWMKTCQALGVFITAARQTPLEVVEKFWAEMNGRPVGQRLFDVDRFELSACIEQAIADTEDYRELHKTVFDFNNTTSRTLEGNKVLVYHALRNLLENAIVWGATSRLDLDDVDFGVQVQVKVYDESNGDTVVSISDSGKGMDARTLATIREVYKEPRRLGSLSLDCGFGTMISAFAITVHCGIITIESEESKGTSIIIRFPKYELRKEEKQ